MLYEGPPWFILVSPFPALGEDAWVGQSQLSHSCYPPPHTPPWASHLLQVLVSISGKIRLGHLPLSPV